MSTESSNARLNDPTASNAPPRCYTEKEMERIRELAYAAYSARLGGPGDALSDWLEAERMFLGATDKEAEAGAPVSKSLPIQSVPTRPAAAKPPRQPTSGKPVRV